MSTIDLVMYFLPLILKSMLLHMNILLKILYTATINNY